MAILGDMKPAILLYFLLLAIPAYARLGETSEQIEARYGKPIKATKPESPATDAEVYEKNGFQIMVGYYEGKSYYEQFRKPEAKEPHYLQEITETERHYLLTANQFSWTNHMQTDKGTIWASDYGKQPAEAVYGNQVLTIRSLRVKKQREADEKKREEENLKDF